MTVLIVGGGPVGNIIALVLADAAIDVHIVDHLSLETQLKDTTDIRGYALSSSSKTLLDTLGLWERLSPNASPIMNIKVTNGATTPRSLNFEYTEENAQAPMGYILEAFRLRQLLATKAKEHPNIAWHDSTSVHTLISQGMAHIQLENGQDIKSHLVIGADGHTSRVRQLSGIETMGWSYDQSALVTTIQHANPHHGTAYEKFLKTGPFATLPMTKNRSAIVWSNHPDTTNNLCGIHEKDFIRRLQEILGSQYRDIQLIQSRLQYPLGVQMAKTYIAPRTALVGDAAHVIHPLAGQGLNLGIRDAAALAELVISAHRLGLDIGSSILLENYQRWRRFDNTALMLITDGLNRLFSNEQHFLHHLHTLGLRLVGAIPPLKKLATRHAMGMIGRQPKLLRGQSL